MADDETDGAGRREPPAVPALGHDSLVDKGVRFGCEAMLGLILLAGLAIYGLVPPERLGVSVALVAGVFGGLAVWHGERFIVGVMKVMRWL